MESGRIRLYQQAPPAHPVCPHYFGSYLFDDLDNSPKRFAMPALRSHGRDPHQIPVEGLTDIRGRNKDIGLGPGARNASESPGVDLEASHHLIERSRRHITVVVAANQ